MQRWIVAPRALIGFVLAMSMAWPVLAQSGNPPFPDLAAGAFYTSKTEVQAACKADMPWQKAKLEEEENTPRLRWEVADQDCAFRTAKDSGMPGDYFTMQNRIREIRTDVDANGQPVEIVTERTIERMTFMLSPLLSGLPPCKGEEDEDTSKCDPYASDANLGTPCDSSCNPLFVGNPINLATGNKYEEQIDSTLPTLPFVRYYNSASTTPSAQMGAAWRHTYDRRIDALSAQEAIVQRPDGRQLHFQWEADQWRSANDHADTLIALNAEDGSLAGWHLFVGASHVTETYTAQGQLISIRDAHDALTTLTYTDGSQLSSAGTALPAGLLWHVADAQQRTLQLGYDALARVDSLTTADGQVTRYQYDTTNHLAQVVFPDQAVRRYLYDEAALTSPLTPKGKLTGIVDEAGQRYARSATRSMVVPSVPSTAMVPMRMPSAISQIISAATSPIR